MIAQKAKKCYIKYINNYLKIIILRLRGKLMKAYKEIVQLKQYPIKIFLRNSNFFGDNIKAHPHWHTPIEILIIKEGSAVIQMDNNIFTAIKDEIVIVGCNQIHSIYSSSSELCSILVFQFYLEEFDLLHNIKFTNCIKEDNIHWYEINNIMSNIEFENNARNPHSTFEIMANIFKLMSLIIKNKDQLYIEENTANKNKDVITEIFDYIDNNYMNNFSVIDITKYIHLSVPHFMRIFKNATGMTFKHYLNLYRINIATKLLLQGNSVSKVALDCGFDNINTFIRLFKEFKDATPTGYVKIHLK